MKENDMGHMERSGNTTAITAHRIIDANVDCILEMSRDTISKVNDGLNELMRDYERNMGMVKGRMCKNQGAGGLGAGFLPHELECIKDNLGITDSALKLKVKDVRFAINSALDAILLANDSAMEQIGGEKGAITGPIMNINKRQVDE